MNIKRFNTCLMILAMSMIISSMASATYKIVIQVSPPRCLSTASLRMWQTRGDFEVLNEPFIISFFLQNDPNANVSSWRSDIPQSYADTWQKIVNLAEHKPVFVKEMGFALLPYVINNPEIIQNPQVHFVFLIRNPHNVTISFYQMFQKTIDKFDYFIGFQPCYEIYQIVQQTAVHKPIIVCAEDLYKHPYETAQALCNNLEIPFVESMLHWENLGPLEKNGRAMRSLGEAWHESKLPKLAYHWHGAAIQSTGFHKPTTHEVDENGNPTFSEVTNDDDRKACFEAYNFNKEYYELLLKEKNKQ